MRIVNDRHSIAFFWMKNHWQIRFNLDFTNRQTYISVQQIITIEIDFLFFRFWYVLYKRK